MTTSTKVWLWVAVIGAIFGMCAFLGLTPFAKQSVTQVIQQGSQAGSPVGATFGDAKVSAIVINLATATSTAIQNNSGSDQYLMKDAIGCEGIGTSQTAYTGAGLASLKVQAATSSTGTGVLTNGNWVFNFTIPTSTPTFTMSSSTVDTATTTNWTVWQAGSWMQFATNATNTAVCTFGVFTLSS